MGRIFVVDLEGITYNCKFCKTQLAQPHQLVSRSFHCQRGKAYLFNTVVNVTSGPPEERMMISGMHTLSDVFCCSCGHLLGWKYLVAHEESQKYKEGKFALESRDGIIDGADSEFYIAFL
ncbi:protein yippee-like At5g53940 isoform X2 [Salvia hispanica]|uniref:protein yippee-like At5g53940 isoform X2 n=1 Tax=Salvia hispanica TaxID=49212 RepID=UPI0020094CBE|nr:protein yippee-like At5g53940 isoform X2 [Salvia hispanica]